MREQVSQLAHGHRVTIVHIETYDNPLNIKFFSLDLGLCVVTCMTAPAHGPSLGDDCSGMRPSPTISNFHWQCDHLRDLSYICRHVLNAKMEDAR